MSATQHLVSEGDEELEILKIPGIMLSYLTLSAATVELLRNSKAWDRIYPWFWAVHVVMAYLHLSNADVFTEPASNTALLWFGVVAASVPLLLSTFAVVLGQNTSYRHLHRVTAAGLPWIWIFWLLHMYFDMMSAFILIPYVALVHAITVSSRRGLTTALTLSVITLGLYRMMLILVGTLNDLSSLPMWIV